MISESTNKSSDTFRLSKVVEFVKKTNHRANEGKKEGQYKFFTSSPVQSKFLDEFDYLGEYLIFGTGGSASIHYCNGPFSATADCLIAKSKNHEISLKFVFQYLKHNMYLLENGFRGAGLKHISKSFIEKIIIISPKKPDAQNKIVSVLEKAEQLREWRKQSNMLTKECLDSIYLKTFGNPLENPKKWPTSRLDKVAQVERGRFSPRPRNNPIYYTGVFPFIQTGDISASGGLLTTWSQTLNYEGKKVSKCFKKGTIVIAIVGATIGETAILDKDMYAPDSVVGISVDPEQTNNFFIEHSLRFWKPIFRAIAPQTARANINLAIIKPIDIPLPPLELQEKFGSLVIKYQQLKEYQTSSIDEIEKISRVLEKKLFEAT